MISKQEAKANGLKVEDSNEHLSREKQEKIEAIKKILPGVVNSEGVVDTEVLKEVLGREKVLVDSNKGYGLQFAGKGLARYEASTSTKEELSYVSQQSKHADTTGNIVIRGDNIDVLKILRQNYTGKIKCIYIDPPYNTGSDNFIYKDNFCQSDAELIEALSLPDAYVDFLENVYGTRTHSGWLAFMMPRLILARDLLTDDGVIFISIDDNEQANLKLLCGEVFGEDNFIANVIVKINPGGRDYGGIALTHEYIIVFSKQPLIELKQIENIDKSFPYKDQIGEFETRELRNRNIKFNKMNRPNLYYPFYVNTQKRDKNGLYEISLEKNEDLTEVSPLESQNVKTVWRWGKEKALRNLNTNIMAKQKKDGGFQIVEKYRSRFHRERSILEETEYRNEKGTLELKKLLDNKAFDYPKSTSLIKRVLQISTEKNDLILDFFAGSGTTGDAVMQLNKEDGGDRKFILVQWDEMIKKGEAAHSFCTQHKMEPVISSILIERLHRAGEKLRQEKNDLDIGYKVYTLVTKPQLKADEAGQLELGRRRKSVTDTLINMVAATSKPLTANVQTLEEGRLYQVEGNYYVLGTCKTNLKDEKDCRIYIDGYANMDLRQWLNLIGVPKENVEVLY